MFGMYLTAGGIGTGLNPRIHGTNCDVGNWYSRPNIGIHNAGAVQSLADWFGGNAGEDALVAFVAYAPTAASIEEAKAQAAQRELLDLEADAYGGEFSGRC